MEKRKGLIDKFQHEVEREDAAQRLLKEKAKFHLLFGNSPIGREVLADIVKNYCHFGEELDPGNPSQIGEYNVGIRILTMAGAFDDKRWVDVIGELIKPLPLPILQEE